MSLLDRPCAASRTICDSCGVRLADGPWLGRPAGGPGGGQLGPGALRPRSGADPFEGLKRDPELGPGVGLALVPAQPLAVQQLGARHIERAAVLLVQGQGRQEQVFIAVEQRPAAVHEGARPALPGVARPGLEQRQGLGRRLRPAEPHRRLDQVGGGPGGGDVEEAPPLGQRFQPRQGRLGAAEAEVEQAEGRAGPGRVPGGPARPAERLGGQLAARAGSSPRAAASSASGSANASTQRCCPVSRASRSPSATVCSASW